MVLLIDAIQSLVPNAEVVTRGDEIEWYDERPQPSDEDIATELARLQAEYDAKQYQRDRLAEYPTLQDCIHALLDGGDTLTDLQAARQAVKDAYPKPGE